MSKMYNALCSELSFSNYYKYTLLVHIYLKFYSIFSVCACIFCDCHIMQAKHVGFTEP